MKVLWCSLMVVLTLRQATAGIVRKPPAFATPVYSNSYLPAAMQVIFHAVEQLKLVQSEEMLLEHSTAKPLPTIQSMKHQQPQSTTPKATSAISTAATTAMHSEVAGTSSSISPANFVTKVSSHGSSETYDDLTKTVQRMEASTASVPASFDHEESPEELNQEVSEVSEGNKTPTNENAFSGTPEIESSSDDDASPQRSTQATVSGTPDDSKRKEPTIDSIVDEIYVIVRPTMSPLIEDSNVTDKSKGMTGISIEKMENIEDEEEETRFTLLGEKVAQVPRPSLNSYLRRTKVPPTYALQQLADLYDALSKDARKQGLARYTGYSDDVLKVLQSSAEGGVGPQLKSLLEKVIERNELTRDDAKTKTAKALRDLDNPASPLNKDLRRLLPLRYMV
ncbi:uncharacterized protein LOC116847792 isoform X2 [Odontomachus brunneus]|uniref:uncharacterized protein LOC116847792 isoform X2 n=1 Tax=Odontomachus brunneus TaxID=486640 RepID=UPI0013F200FA|nr:uncharacterized protein LOC116847792 isoform X2 [Odontomachus brunneus]